MRSSLLPIVAAAALLAGATTSQAASYAIDPGHTYVTFEISHFGTSPTADVLTKRKDQLFLTVQPSQAKLKSRWTPARSTPGLLRSTSTCKAQTCLTLKNFRP